MKAFANWVMKGRMQAVIAATVLAILGLLVTPLALFSVAVVALTVLRQGWREGALVVGSALLAIGGLGGLLFDKPLATVLIGLILWLPAAVLGGVLGRSGSLRLALEASALGAALIVGVQYLLISDPAAFWSDALNEALRQRVDPATLATVNVAELVDMLAGWMPGGIAATWFLGTAGALMLARYWSALIDRPGAFGEEFRELRFGRWLLILVPLLFVLGVLISGDRPGLIGQLYLIGMVVFLLQGVSLVHALVAIFGASLAWLVGLYLLLIFVAPQGTTLVSVVGYVDGWLNLRARARARRSSADGDH